MTKRPWYFLLYFFIIWLTGCNGSAKIETTSTSNNNPTVTLDSSSGGIANNEINVSLTPSIVLKFSVSMNPSTVNPNNVFLSTSNNTSNPQNLVAITNIIASSNNTIFNFSSVSSLNPNTKYYVIINANTETATNTSVTGDLFNFTTGNITAPIATLLSPANNTVNIGLNPSIQVQFSKAVTNAYYDTIVLRETNGALASFNSITQGDNNIYTLVLANPLKQQTTYYLSLSNFINDGNGHYLSPTIFNFSTAYFAPPTVSIISPSNNAIGISTNPNIQIQFSEPVLNVNNYNTVSLHQDSQTGTVIPLNPITPGTTAYSYSTNPTSLLNPQTTYYLVLNDGIIDNYGNALLNTSFNFTTAGNNPTVVTVTPNNNAIQIPLTSNIQIQFNKLVQNVNNSTVTLHQGSPTGSIVSLANPTTSDNITYNFNQIAALNLNTIYYLLLNSGINDINGNELQPVMFSFTTIGVNPTIIATTPSNNESQVSTSPTIQIQFSATMQNVNSATVSLHQDSLTGTPVSINFLTTGNNTTYNIVPTNPLNYQTTYYLVMNNGIADIDGNTLVATNFSFTTAGISPTVTTITPNSGAIHVSTSPNIQIQFNKIVQNVNSNTVSLHQDTIDGIPIDLNFITTGKNNTYDLTPASSLNNQTVYFLVLNNGITDINGDPLIPINFYFTTAGISPTVISTVPNNGATKVSLNPKIQIQFSKIVQNVNISTIILHQGSVAGPIVSLGNPTSNDNITYNFSQVATLGLNTTYYLTLSSEITDIGGNQLIPTTINFTTGVSYSWINLGTADPDGSSDSYQSLIMNNNILYVAFGIPFNNFSAVSKFDGVAWSLVGRAIINGSNLALSLAINKNNNNLYVASKDASINNKISVFIFNNIDDTWEYVGVQGFATGHITSKSLVIDSTGILYLAYQDSTNANKTTVMQFTNGAWTNLGSTGFSQGAASYQSLALDNKNTPYVAYQDRANANKTTVMQFTNGSWVNVGNAGFSQGGANYQSLALDNKNTPYVAYQDESNANATTVMQFINGGWVNVGNVGFSQGAANYQSLVLSTNNVPYVAYQDEFNANKTTVMQFNNNGTWTNVVNAGISQGAASFQSLVLDSNNMPYVAYQDESNSNNTTVMKLVVSH